MKTIISAILLAILVLSQGCCTKTQSFEFGCVDACVPDTIIIETTKTIHPTIPPLPDEPIPSKVKPYITEINGQQFYMMSRHDTAKLDGNWESYKGYAQSLRAIIVSLDNNNSEGIDKDE